MRIAAFDVREDEREILQQTAADCGAGLELHSESLFPEQMELLKDIEGVTVLGQQKLEEEQLDRLAEKGVRWISTRTIGYNHIDVSYAHRRGLRVANASYAPNGVAEYTIMLMLLCLRNYKQALWRGQVNDYSLLGLRGKELCNLTVGVVGAGAIGTKVMEILRGFGCRILVHARSRRPEAETPASYVSLEELYREADIITLHLPLTEGTYHMINREALLQMKDGVVLINTARGPLMCLEDVIWGIENRKVGALGLDVVEQEEGIYHRDLRSDIISNKNMAYIRQFPNVVMTQHMAFYTDEAVRSMAECGIRSLVQFAQTGTSEYEIRL